MFTVAFIVTTVIALQNILRFKEKLSYVSKVREGQWQSWGLSPAQCMSALFTTNRTILWYKSILYHHDTWMTSSSFLRGLDQIGHVDVLQHSQGKGEEKGNGCNKLSWAHCETVFSWVFLYPIGVERWISSKMLAAEAWRSDLSSPALTHK